MIYFKAFFFSWKGDKKPLEACCHSRTISAVCHLQDGRRGRGKRQDMDSTFIYKQGSLNRGHFIIALKFTGASKPACHPAGWPWLGSSRVCEVVGGGRILTHCPTGWKRCPGNSLCSWWENWTPGNLWALGVPDQDIPTRNQNWTPEVSSWLGFIFLILRR